MLAKKNRFQGRPSMNAVFRRGKKSHLGYMSIRFLATDGPEFRVAVVVSKKVHKNAVIRNKIRRAIYLFCQENANLFITGDIIISVHDEKITELNKAEITNLLTQLFERAEIIQKTTKTDSK